MELRVYPNLTASLGGATLARVGKRSVFVQVQGREYRLPLSEAQLYLEDGLALAEKARAWAYRHA